MDVFPRFEPLDLAPGKIINHAHNDYLEWLFESGLLAVAVLLWGAVLFARHWPRLWRGRAWPRSRFVQIGAGIGVLMLMLHGLVDYNLRIPANMVYFAFLLAIFLRPPEEPEYRPKTRCRRRTARHESAATPVASEPEPAPDGEPRRPPRRNPFMDEDPA
jgi:O-antigen ligase